MVLGRAAPVADLVASQRRPRESARVGALEQLVLGLLVEAVASVEAGAGGVAISWLLFWRSRNRWFAASAFLLASSSSWSTTLSSSEDSRRGSRVASLWVGELMVRLEKR